MTGLEAAAVPMIMIMIVMMRMIIIASLPDQSSQDQGDIHEGRHLEGLCEVFLI